MSNPNVYSNTETMAKPTCIPFMRITVLGLTGSGKTNVINSFVNCQCPPRYVSTERPELYHKRMDVIDKGEFDELSRPLFLELEDTPGSEKGPPGGGAMPQQDADAAPVVRKGSRVIVQADKNKLMRAFEDWNQQIAKGKQGNPLYYKVAMDGMLGLTYPVKVVARDGSIGLPSPDGSEGGVWNFPDSGVSLKVGVDTPISNFFIMEKSQKYFDYPHDAEDRKKFLVEINKPFAAFPRPIGPPDKDKSLTRNRMGFFICFDLSDENDDSFREAMNIHGMMKKYLDGLAKKPPVNKQLSMGSTKPIVMLLGTKTDRTAYHEAIERNRVSSLDYCEKEGIKVMLVSAKTNHGIGAAFQAMVDAIGSKESLWQLEGGSGGSDDGGLLGGGCSLS